MSALDRSAVVTPQTGTSGLLRGPLLAWAALFINVLAFSDIDTVFPIPGIVGRLITQGALVFALLAAFLANPRGVIRPSVFMLLLSLLTLVSVMSSLHSEFLAGAAYRAARLTGFVLVLWLLTPWWGSSQWTLLKAHLTCLRAVLITVVIGYVLAPGKATAFEGRLSGVLWPIPPTQVAHFAAMLIGCTAVLWFCGAVRGRVALVTVAISAVLLILTHTRTALLAMVVGLVVAGASLFLGQARVRRATGVFVTTALVGGVFFTPFILEWLSRGQSSQDTAQLTGRTKVWTALVNQQRPYLEDMFGSGLSNKSFNGLPIDNSWLAVYLDQGWFGVSLCAGLLLLLLATAVLRPRGLRRAVALFIVAYCLVASITETALGDATPYLLEMVVAGALLARAPDPAVPEGTAVKVLP